MYAIRSYYELQSVTDTREQLEFEKRYYVVVAPCDGYVSNFGGIHRGSFIFSNQSIATINPVEHLQAECYVSPSNIGYLKKGDNASLQVDAYRITSYNVCYTKLLRGRS